jgi:RimJ/RimL family protein N-acetyltransferase
VDNAGWLAQAGATSTRTGVLLLTDQIVELRPLAVVDAAEHLDGQDREWRRWLGSGRGSANETMSWLCRCEECWRSGGPVFAFGVRAVGLDGLLGTVELRVNEPALPPGRASISCGLYPQARGRGIGMRACRLASCFALHALADVPWNVTEVVAQIDPFNHASLQMIERAGFVYTDSCVGAGEAWEQFAIDRPHLECMVTWPRPDDVRRTA